MAKYNESVAETIVSLIEDDFCSVAEICRVTGISRKTFYCWKETVPGLAKEIFDAECRREDRIRQMLYSSLKKRLDGHMMVEEKETFLPDELEPEKLVLQSKVIRRKYCLPDLKTIKLLLDRQDRIALSKKNEEDIPEEMDIHIIDTTTPTDIENEITEHIEESEIVPAEEKESLVDDPEEAEAKIMLDRLYRLKAERIRTIKASNNHPIFSPAGKRGKKRRK
ncbi:helix-turn-helix domain-containing protein [uncultured Dysgonomonas sp.]|uniref:Homeodomain phBC6A51-type domain-containing protein n=1 Tax=uncultured Dysgonomonas sp. TaxID=206096 RepID=A0A212JES3_9BACT|nr:helix-turn-helix domain-containing protein [uncultured Dysgonomonas sp.]SBV97926.1 conserved hypothetical protein [uncultured Dysgonomonas sp.]